MCGPIAFKSSEELGRCIGMCMIRIAIRHRFFLAAFACLFLTQAAQAQIADLSGWRNSHLSSDNQTQIDLDYKLLFNSYRGSTISHTAPLWVNVKADGLSE